MSKKKGDVITYQNHPDLPRSAVLWPPGTANGSKECGGENYCQVHRQLARGKLAAGPNLDHLEGERLTGMLSSRRIPWVVSVDALAASPQAV
jgi:hypothetical protein